MLRPDKVDTIERSITQQARYFSFAERSNYANKLALVWVNQVAGLVILVFLLWILIVKAACCGIGERLRDSALESRRSSVQLVEVADRRCKTINGTSLLVGSCD